MKNNLKIILVFLTLVACNFDGSTKHKESGTWWTEEERMLIVSELNRTTNELRAEITDLTDDQWHFRENIERWSIAEIIEHLEIQNLLHFRELSVISRSPQHLQYRLITDGRDSYFSEYSTDTLRSKAQWFLEPMGRYCSMKEGQDAFYKARKELELFVERTEIDLRKQFTFRSPVEGKNIEDIKIGQVRDLHQLLLTGIAHTDRHLNQIRKIKLHLDYPK
ncbi:DinB family protein [Flagellimonas sp. 2504JD1-5]